ncbi:hypothetical protein [Bifidobacterium longum]|uniref:hypothetical protein n=1 Tax=Bifidobacterium longum TaxID=216816 RepID=UPI00207A8B8A|nr:hypothetical protein [Bifidobacterium longum]MBT9823623.1 hypothetical protein [Bifidobacterium longum]
MMKETKNGRRENVIPASAVYVPQPGGAGSLANIAFFGTAKGGGTHEFYEYGEDELPRLAEHVAKAAVEVV